MINPSRLSLARKRRGLSLVELSRSTGVSTRTISAYENGKANPSYPTLQKISIELDFPVDFFFLERVEDVAIDCVSFRALSKMSARQRDAAVSLGELSVDLQKWIAERYTLPENDVPTFNFSRGSEELSPEAVADVVRAEWGLGNSPIPNLVHLLESRGVRVFSLDQECSNVDAFSFWNKKEAFLLLNTFKTAERSRFDAAHELGHLILHKQDRLPHGVEAEREANSFASAFLMPRESIISCMPKHASVQQIIQAKYIWRVSAMALTHRLQGVGLSTEWHYRTTCTELSRLGYRKGEPKGIQRENSQVLKKVFDHLRSKSQGLQEVAESLKISQKDLQSLVFNMVITALEGGGQSIGTQRKTHLRVV